MGEPSSAKSNAADVMDNPAEFLPILQQKQIELFCQFDRFAKENNIRYFALGGTLLGAVREGGFIPWDDDIDLGIPRKDYERFLSMVEAGETPFMVRSFQTTPDFFERFPQIVDNSIQVLRRDRSVPEVTGAWVDFFPLDGAPSAYPLRWLWSKLMTVMIGMHRLSCIDVNGISKSRVKKSPIYIAIFKLNEVVPIGKLINKKKALYRLDKMAKLFSYEKSKWINHSMSSRLPYMFPKTWYGEGRYYAFEDTEVYGPTDYDSILTQLYGDYMTPPSEEDKGKHFKNDSEDS